MGFTCLRERILCPRARLGYRITPGVGLCDQKVLRGVVCTLEVGEDFDHAVDDANEGEGQGAVARDVKQIGDVDFVQSVERTEHVVRLDLNLGFLAILEGAIEQVSDLLFLSGKK